MAKRRKRKVHWKIRLYNFMHPIKSRRARNYIWELKRQGRI